jgi:purine-binding chemotaxis protein CheW
MCGIPVLSVRDVLSRQAITRIPLAPPEIAGSLNLRGRIVTVVDLRYRLALPNGLVRHEAMNVVVEREGELYSLLTDSVGEVLPLPLQERAEIPATLDQLWREVSSGIQRIDEKLIILLDVQRILCIG